MHPQKTVFEMSALKVIPERQQDIQRQLPALPLGRKYREMLFEDPRARLTRDSDTGNNQHPNPGGYPGCRMRDATLAIQYFYSLPITQYRESTLQDAIAKNIPTAKLMSLTQLLVTNGRLLGQDRLLTILIYQPATNTLTNPQQNNINIKGDIYRCQK